MTETTQPPLSENVDIAWILKNLDELHPLNFRLAFNLTHDEAAMELCIEPQTMRAYSKNNPSKRVKKLAATMAKKWIVEGRPVDIQYLIKSSEFVDQHD